MRINCSAWQVCQMTRSDESGERPTSSNRLNSRPRNAQNSPHLRDCICCTSDSTEPMIFASARIPFTVGLLLPLLNYPPESRYAFFCGFVRNRKAFSLNPKLLFTVHIHAIILRIELFLVGAVIFFDKGKLIACQACDYFGDPLIGPVHP